MSAHPATLPGLVAAVAWATTCAQPQGSADPLAARCVEAVEYLLPGWNELHTAHARRTGGGLGVTLRFEGVVEATGERATEYASCAFEEGERPAALRVVLGDYTLDARELALVNAELLLRDLSRGTG